MEGYNSVNPSILRSHGVLDPRIVLGSVHGEKKVGVDSPAGLKPLGMEGSEIKLPGAAG